MIKSSWIIALILTAVGCVSQAQPTFVSAHSGASKPEEVTADPKSAALDLFNEAEKLAEAGRYAEACPKYQRSDDLDHRLLTLFQLAVCYEKIGRLASAWTAFTQVADEALKDSKPESEENERTARSRANQLVPKLPMLTIEVSENVADVHGLVIRQDHENVGPKLWNTARAIDPGKHTIVVTAPHKHEQRLEVAFKEAERKSVRIDELESLPMSRRRVAALAIGGAGVAGVIVGSIAGGVVFSKYGQAADVCDVPFEKCTHPKAINLEGETKTPANVANGAFIVGGAALGAAAILYFTAPASDETKPQARWQLEPLVTHHGAGVVVGRSF